MLEVALVQEVIPLKHLCRVMVGVLVEVETKVVVTNVMAGFVQTVENCVPMLTCSSVSIV
jgi:hypothetical protein